MKLRDLELLVRVAQTGSMTAAAQQLHLTPAAVSAAVQRVEHAIGVRLFERTTRSLHPTDEGLAFLDACQEMVQRWHQALDEASGTALEGEVHLTAPADTTYEILQPVVADLCALHPGLRLVVHTSDLVHHLHRDAIDMAIRYGALPDSTLAARKLAEAPVVLVAAPAYLAEFGAPDSPDALPQHRCVTLHRAGAPSVAWSLIRGERAHEVVLKSPLCGDGYLARRWAVAGRGIAFKSLFDVIDDLEAGRLVQVLPAYTGGVVAIHAVFPSRQFQPARVRVVTQAIEQCFAARAARCRAWNPASGGGGAR